MLCSCRRRGRPSSSPTANFSEELLGWHKERVPLKQASDDDHGVSAHDVYHGVAAKFGQMVGADNDVVVATPYLVHAGFELDEVVDIGLIFGSPIHATHNAAKGESSRGVATGDLLERVQHPILIETPIRQVGFGVERSSN